MNNFQHQLSMLSNDPRYQRCQLTSLLLHLLVIIGVSSSNSYAGSESYQA